LDKNVLTWSAEMPDEVKSQLRHITCYNCCDTQIYSIAGMMI